MHAIAPEAHNSYPFFGERGMLHRQLASASVRTAGACKLLYISRQKFGRFLALVPDFSSRVKFVADTRVKLNRLRDQEGIDHLQRTKAMEVMEAAAATELLNLPSMRRCCSVVKTEMGNAQRSQQPMRPHSLLQETAVCPVPRSGPERNPLDAEERVHVVALPLAPAQVAHVFIQALHSSL